MNTCHRTVMSLRVTGTNRSPGRHQCATRAAPSAAISPAAHTGRPAHIQPAPGLLDYGSPMTQPPRSASPLTARLYDLEYPRSLGVYSTYQEVQAVVDTLADNHFPVQSTLIVGTDLKLMERVTGRKTWGRVIGQGVLSGLWMGLFLGLLLMFITPSNVLVVLTSVLLGIVFFTVWSVIGYAMSGGKRDFTSMVATIPMQYELLVEHKHADQARRLLAESGASPAPAPVSPATPLPGHSGPAGQFGASQQGSGPFGASPQGSGSFGASQQGGRPSSGADHPAAPRQNAPQQPGGGQPGSRSAPSAPAAPGAETPTGRPLYGQPAPSAPSAPTSETPGRPSRPSFGQPAGTPLHEDSRPHSSDPEVDPAAEPRFGEDRPEDPQDYYHRGR